MEKRCNMIEFGRLVDEQSIIVLNFLKPVRKVDELSIIVLNFLKPVKKVFWGTRKKSIAVV